MLVIWFLHLCVQCTGLDRNGYEYFSELHGWLKLHKKSANWSAARINCHLEGTFLASPWTIEFKSIINKLQSSTTQSLPVLYSGTQVTFPEGVYTYLEEKSSISLDQSALERFEQCVVFFANGTMGEVDCKRQLPYVCFAPDPSVSTLESCWQNNLGEQLVKTNSKLAAPEIAHNPYKVHGEEVHRKLEREIEVILVNGLKIESREKIMQKYSIPKKATLFKAPKLNIELKNLLHEQITARDKILEERQQLLGTALAALVMIADNINNEMHEGSLNSTTGLADVARLLSEVHYQDTCIRRKLISPSLDLNTAEAVKNVKRDEFLYEKYDINVKPADTVKKLPTKPLKPKKQTTTKKFMKMETFLPFPGIKKIKSGKAGKEKLSKVPRLAHQRHHLVQFALLSSRQKTQSASKHKQRKLT